MAGKEAWVSVPTGIEQPSIDLAYRQDLASAIGLIVAPPANQLDENGEIRWGKTDSTLTGDSQTLRELAQYLAASADEVLSRIEGLPPTDRKAPTHAYEIPPAAQSWQEIAVMLWEHGKPYLENSDLVLSLALSVKELVSLTRKWFDVKNAEISELNQPDYQAGRPGTHDYVVPRFMLTQGSIVALIVSNLVDRFGFNEDLEIDVSPRGPEGYNTPNHPSAHLSYLVRCAFAGRVFVYILTSRGEVTEHFEIRNSRIVPLPTPDLLGSDDYPNTTVPGDDGLNLAFRGQHRP